jgi:probable rRNA maturation factor
VKFYVQNLHPKRTIAESETIRLVRRVLKVEGSSCSAISVIFVDNAQMRKMNKRFLNHDFPTDVIAFEIEQPPELEAEIYISLDQAVRQAKTYGVSIANETRRLVIHGVLHLVGYRDKTARDRRAMKDREDAILKSLPTSKD